MDRVSLECANCKGKDFEVEISCLPTAVTLSCKTCGRVTPLLVLSEDVNIHSDILAINGKTSTKLYEDAFCGEITPAMIRRAHEKDMEDKKC